MMRKLVAVAVALGGLSACVVEEVTVDTGGPEATDVTPEDRGDDGPARPSDPADGGEPGDDIVRDDVPGDGVPYVEPSELLAGDLVLAFVVADGAADLSTAVDVALYGEPDVTVATWAVRGTDELALSLQVSDRSPAGTLDVVVDLADGSVLRVADGITVR